MAAYGEEFVVGSGHGATFLITSLIPSSLLIEPRVLLEMMSDNRSHTVMSVIPGLFPVRSCDSDNKA